MIRLRRWSRLIARPSKRQRSAVLLWVLALACVLRLAAVLLIPVDYRLHKDAAEYLSVARQLLNERTYGKEPGAPYAVVPPGYPLFIASIFAMSNQRLMAVRLAQVILGTLMVWLTYLIGREVASWRTGLLAAFVSAVYPVWVIWPALFLTETLYAVPLLAFVWLLMRSMKTCTAKNAITTGVTFGLALLTREVLFGFPLLLPLALWWSRVSWRSAGSYVLVFGVAALLTLSPWLARNYRVFGAVFYTERTAAIQYQLTGSGYLAPRYAYLADESIPPPSKKPPEVTERFGRASDMINIRGALSNPVTYLRRLGNRLVEFWLHPNGLQSLPDNLVIRSAYVAVHIALLALAAGGIATMLRLRDAGTGVAVLLLAYLTGTCVFLTGPNPRYTLPFLPVIFVYSAKGMLALVERFWLRQPLEARRPQR